MATWWRYLQKKSDQFFFGPWPQLKVFQVQYQANRSDRRTCLERVLYELVVKKKYVLNTYILRKRLIIVCDLNGGKK